MLQHFESKDGTYNGHERFRELCALYTSATLNEEEIKELDRHLPGCRECRDLLQEYARTVRQIVPVIADEQEIELTSGFDAALSNGRSRLLASVENAAGPTVGSAPKFDQHPLGRPVPAALIHALATVLIICAAFGGYFVGLKAHGPAQLGESKSRPSVQVLVPAPKVDTTRAEDIKRLSNEVNRLGAELLAAKKLAKEFNQTQGQQADIVSRLADQNARVKAERDELFQNFNNTQARLAQVSQELNRLRSERDEAVLQNSDLNRTFDAFKVKLQTLSDTISEQQRLLAADRDIRELMGARDLLLADVFDIDPNGRNKKPFGRIFYTKNKSLIFYAFDLDRQPGVQNAGAFQVWGAKTADNGKGSAFNMGIFYMDNEAMRRWVLKFDNPKVLAQIDSIFVTVEPHGGSNHPSGKQLLFASLRGEPNHP